MQQWAGIIQEQKQSGLSIKSFCEDAGLKTDRYFYWLRKLRETACEELVKTQNSMSSLTSTKSSSGGTVVWAGVNMNRLNTTRQLTHNSIKICREGWTVTVEPGFDTETLTEALRAVSQICC